MQHYFRQAYVMVCVILAMPVLLWPLAVYSTAGLNPGLNIEFRWLFAANIVLVAASIADSILGGMRDKRSMWSGMTWIAIAAIVGAHCVQFPQSHVFMNLIRVPEGAFVMATLFALHGCRHLPAVWFGRAERWWCFPAWLRDFSLSASMFAWLILFS